MLNGFTVKESRPLNVAYMFTAPTHTYTTRLLFTILLKSLLSEQREQSLLTF